MRYLYHADCSTRAPPRPHPLTNHAPVHYQAEHELRKTQEEFDKQVEVVSSICNKIITSNEQHVKYLSKFVEAQAEYYQLANQHLIDLLNNREDTPNSSARTGSTGFATFAALSENLPEE